MPSLSFLVTQLSAAKDWVICHIALCLKSEYLGRMIGLHQFANISVSLSIMSLQCSYNLLSKETTNFSRISVLKNEVDTVVRCQLLRWLP